MTKLWPRIVSYCGRRKGTQENFISDYMIIMSPKRPVSLPFMNILLSQSMRDEEVNFTCPESGKTDYKLHKSITVIT